MQISLPGFLYAPYSLALRATALVERWLTPAFVFALRLYVAQVFFRSGWLKAADWGNTLDLFDYVYHVPLLPPHVAAALGMGGELGLSALLALGLAGRFAAAGLFVVNGVAAISFPDISDLGLKDHVLWGAMLLVPLFYGAGGLSLDAWLRFRPAERSAPHTLEK